jgi:diphosphomevalonate decarboxylase
MSSRQVTVSAPANIAFVKYWGVAAPDQAIPLNPSLSMTLSMCRTRSTVALLPRREGDRVSTLGSDGQRTAAHGALRRGIEIHLDRLRQALGTDVAFDVTTTNTFPAAAGLASSASGFAALAVGVTQALGLKPSAAELSELARLSGSGSAARSTFGGYVEWPAPEATGTSLAAAQIAPSEHWALCDIIAVVERGPKEVSSRQGHLLATSSPHFARRQELLPDRLRQVRRAVAKADLERLGPVLEEEAVELHLIAMSSCPQIFYWKPATLAVLSAVRDLRRRGLGAWATMDAGANVHVLCLPATEGEVAATLSAVPGVLEVIRDRVGSGPRVEEVGAP